MTQYQVTLDAQTLQRLFSGDNQLGQLLEAVLNQVLDTQVSERRYPFVLVDALVLKVPEAGRPRPRQSVVTCIIRRNQTSCK